MESGDRGVLRGWRVPLTVSHRSSTSCVTSGNEGEGEGEGQGQGQGQGQACVLGWFMAVAAFDGHLPSERDTQGQG